jgi:DNA polymerase III subunit delta'
MNAAEITHEELPWLRGELESLRSAHAARRLSHAILIHASPGIGGNWLAAWIARLALCTSEAAPCGRCAACGRVKALQHPDLSLVQPEEDSTQIRIEQVRDLCQDLALTSHQGHGKVAIVTPADSMNRFAANALLKTLEEPPPATVLVLVAAQPSRLPPTVRSRCQLVHVAAPSRAESVAWLEGTAGSADWNAVLDTIGEAPLLAATLDATAIAAVRAEVHGALEEASVGRLDPVATAERWSRSELALRLGCFESWLTDHLYRAAGVAGESREVRPGAHLQAGRSPLNIRALFGLVDGVRELRSLLDTSLNKSLALEQLLRRMR